MAAMESWYPVLPPDSKDDRGQWVPLARCPSGDTPMQMRLSGTLNYEQACVELAIWMVDAGFAGATMKGLLR